LIFGLVLATRSEVVSAQERSLKNLSLEELSRIEVTEVLKEATDAFRTPAAVSVLTRQDIARSGATTIPDLLRLVPGVEVAQISSNKWAIGIRGFEGLLSKSVLVLIDGRSVYTPLFAGVYWEMQDTLIEDIERIEVIRGPGGTIWGANAINGVINIVTRSARDTRGILVTAAAGNVERGELGVRYGAGTDTFSYRLWGKGFKRAAQFHADDVNFDDWGKVQAGLRADWSPTLRDDIAVSAAGYGSHAGSRLAISTFSPPALVNIERNAELSGQHVNVAWRHALPSGADLQVRAYFDRTDREDLNYRETRNTFDFDFIHHFSSHRNDITWGAGFRKSPSRFYQTVPNVIFTPAEETYSIYSAFAQNTVYLLGNRLTAIVGSKFEHNSYSGFELQPSARVSWTPSDQYTVWGAVTRAVRTPSRIEEGFQFSAFASPSGPLYLRLIGDSQFDPERLIGYELGFRAYLRGRGFVGINAFYNRYDNLLSVENRPPEPESSPEPPHLILPLFFRNGIEAQTKGIEIASLWEIGSWWRVSPSYSYLHLNASRDPNSNDASTVGQLEGDTPRHKWVVKSIHTLPRDINLDLTYRYMSAIPNQRIPSYSTGDIRIAKRITPEVEVSVVGQNLLQPHHQEYAGLPGGTVEIRRSAYLRVTWSR
jgi:iron complex outermembrane receptor protein